MFSQYCLGAAFFGSLVYDGHLITFYRSIQFMDKVTLGNSAVLGIMLVLQLWGNTSLNLHLEKLLI